MAAYKYDAFLSFAAEDKQTVANPLYEELINAGLNVWYSGREFQLGMSIEDQVKAGLEESRFGIILISPYYFKTNWAQKELGALWAKEREGFQVLIPVIHDMTPEEVGELAPDLAERWSVLSSQGFPAVAERISHRIQQAPRAPLTRKTRKKKMVGRVLLPALLLLIAILFVARVVLTYDSDQTRELIHATVDERILSFQTKVEERLEDATEDWGLIPASKTQVVQHREEFARLDAHYRNFYRFENGFKVLQFQKHVGPATGIDFGSWTPKDDYGFEYPSISMSSGDAENGLDIRVFYFNTQRTSYIIESVDEQDSLLIARVHYQHPLRLAGFHYEHGRWTSYRKHTTYSLMGYRPTEAYHFVRTATGWQFSHCQ